MAELASPAVLPRHRHVCPGTGSPIAVGTSPDALAVGTFNTALTTDEIAVANYHSNTVSLLLNSGTGVFLPPTAAQTFAVGTHPDGIVAGKFTDGGNTDLAVANRDSDNVTVLLGTGTDGFTASPGSPIAVGTQPSSIAAGKFANAGGTETHQDLAVANYGDDTVSILLADGAGNFAAAPVQPTYRYPVS